MEKWDWLKKDRWKEAYMKYSIIILAVSTSVLGVVNDSSRFQFCM